MALATILAGTSLAMGAVGSLAQYQQGQYASEVARRQSEALQQQSQYVQQTAGQQINAQDYRASHVLSSIQAKAAAGGIESTEGSTGQIFEASAEEARINDMYTKYAANVQSKQLEYQGTLGKIEGQREADAAKIGAVGGLISSGIKSYGAYKEYINPFDEFTSASNF